MMISKCLARTIACVLCGLVVSNCRGIQTAKNKSAGNSPAPLKRATAQPFDTSKLAYVIQSLDRNYKYNADGTGVETMTAVIRVLSQAGIQQFGNLSLPYQSANQRAEILYVRVRRPDGQVVMTPPDNVQDLPAPVTLQAPMYSDLHIKQLPVTSLNPGDTLEYQVRLTRLHPEIPNEFWMREDFLDRGAVLQETVEVSVPDAKYVKVASATVQPTVQHHGSETIYRWQSSHAPSSDADDLAPKPAPDNRKASIQLTTFHNWQQVGEWYRGLEADRVVVTPQIRQQAQEITRGLKTDDERQRAIYTYVSTQFRYIGLSFGVGRYQPHAATVVLQNRFGDCKDKHTLFAALMKAAGYTVWPALIGSGAKLDPDVPYPGQFDHVISLLPQGKQVEWLDTTEEVAPFGMLMAPLRDKQALVIPSAAAPELQTTPANPPFAEADEFSMKGSLDKNAVLTGSAELSLRGDLELLLRAAFHATPQENWNKLGQNVSYMMGFAGEVSHLEAGNPDDTASPFKVTYDYLRKEYGGGNGRQITPPLPPVPFSVPENARKPADDVLLGAPGIRDYQAAVTLPNGDTASLPADFRLETDFAEYRETSSVRDGVLLARRIYKVKLSKLPLARWDEYHKFVKAVSDREDEMIAIATSNSNAPAIGNRNVLDAWKLVNQAYAAMLADQLGKSEELLKRAEAINPDQWGLAGTYGDLYFKQNHPERSITAYQQELENNPTNVRAAGALMNLLLQAGEADQAAALIEAALKRQPNSSPLLLMLATIRMRQHRTADAAALFNKVAENSNHSPESKVGIGSSELRAGLTGPGQTMLQSAIETATRPITINDAAYELADHNQNLTLAAASAKRAVEEIEKSTVATSSAAIGEQGQKSAATIRASNNSLGAVWDTVGWIDFRLGKYKEAERYLRAALLLRPDFTVADHLGQVYEKLGDPQHAIFMYHLALRSGLSLDEWPEVQRRMKALEVVQPAKQPPVPNGATDFPGSGAVIYEHSFEITNQPAKPQFARFMVLAAKGKVKRVQPLDGESAPLTLQEPIRRVDLKSLFPDSGPEEILLYAVVECAGLSKQCNLQVLPNPPVTAR